MMDTTYAESGNLSLVGHMPWDPNDTGPDTSIVTFVRTRFIPEHVALKSRAGKVHYQAILKHILRPETVRSMFCEEPGSGRALLRELPGWPYLDGLSVAEINQDHVQHLTTAASLRGYSPQTVKHIKNVISAVISHAKRVRMFDGDNPVTKVKLAPVLHKDGYGLNRAQAKAVLQKLRSPEREIALISMATGLGVSEICSLQWKHVNLSSWGVRIEGEWLPSNGILIARRCNGAGDAPATADRRRIIIAPDSLAGTLRRVKREQRGARPGDLVIQTAYGEPIQPVSARAVHLKPVGRELQIPTLSWQVLKRTHDSLLGELRHQLADELVLSVQ